MPPRLPSPFTSPHLRRLLLRPFSSPSDHSPLLLRSQSPFLSFFKSFSCRVPTSQEPSVIAEFLSSELLRDPKSDPPMPLSQRLDIYHSKSTFSPSIVHETLSSSPAAGRAALELLTWLSDSGRLPLSDEVCSHFVNYFGRRKDFKAVDEILARGKGVIGSLTFNAYVDRLIRAGRSEKVVSAFENMEADFGIVRNRQDLNFVVSKLCENGYASSAEKMVKSLANEFFPDEYVCDLLIKAWCVDEKLDEARRLAREMYRGGFEIGVTAYNSILDCVCRLCRKKDAFKMQVEAEQVLLDMDVAGVPRNTETFNVLITNLCKIRKTEDAMGLFFRMGEWGCHPDETTFHVLIRSLYQAARVGEGDEMIDRMKSAGFGDYLGKKAYYEFLKILCGIERVDHALSVFAKMKKDGCVPGVKTYELLIRKLWAHGRVEKANNLFNEGVRNGVPLEAKTYEVDQRLVKKPVVVKKKKGKKRLTLPEKTVLKRKKLKKLRLSYVKQDKSTRRRMM